MGGSATAGFEQRLPSILGEGEKSGPVMCWEFVTGGVSCPPPRPPLFLLIEEADEQLLFVADLCCNLAELEGLCKLAG